MLFYGYMASDHMVTSHIARERKEINVLFKDALNTFYLRLYGVRDGILILISSKGSFICTIPQ